jgi:RNA polymerase sigma-70 factor (ECF subfamily)
MDNDFTNNHHVSPELLIALRQGNHEAFAEVYSHYRKSVYGFLSALIRSHEIAEDITHNVFIGVWENRAKLDPAQGIHRYLFTVAKYMAMHYFRRKRIENNHFHYAWIQTVQDIVPEEVLFAKEADLLVDVAISKMPHTRKQIFVMYYKGGFNYTQIAQALDMKKATVANHLTHAKNDIRKMLRNCVKK